MGTFNTRQLLYADPSLIPAIASRIESTFAAEGYEVQNDSLMSGGADISLTKGGIFRSVLGLKTALKISLSPQGGNILFDASVGIFGQQAIPTIIMLFFAWPVVITQIWGLIQQSQLDDRALNIAKEVIKEKGGATPLARPSNGKKFCAGCGTNLPEDAVFCPRCGRKQ